MDAENCRLRGAVTARLLQMASQMASGTLENGTVSVLLLVSGFSTAVIGAISGNRELCSLHRMTADLPSCLNGLKKTERTTTSRRRVVEKQDRSLFFSTKKKHAKREEWRNPTTEEKEKIAQKLECNIVID